jgi:pimeloyl-ACP methyl ester carboxylesterase
MRLLRPLMARMTEKRNLKYTQELNVLLEKKETKMKERQADTTTGQAMPAPTATVQVSDKDELDVWVVGEGTPVVLVHGGLFYFFLKPLAEELAKKGDYQAIWYHRRGYRGKPTEPVDVREQARDVVKILDALEISKAHVVGHSAGVAFTLEVAMQAHDRVLSAALFDASVANLVPSFEVLKELFKPSIEKARAGDFEGGAAALLAALGSSKERLERALPGAWSAMLEDAPNWFQVDQPVLMKWEPDPAKVKAIEVPLAFMSVSGLPPIEETGELLKKWQPTLTMLEISTDDHFFPITEPAETAEVYDKWIKSFALVSE